MFTAFRTVLAIICLTLAVIAASPVTAFVLSACAMANACTVAIDQMEKK